MSAATIALLGGCASFAPDGGFDRVASLTQERIGQAPVYQRSEADVLSAAPRIDELLKSPLSVEGAVELAFLGNRGLQARFSELGIADALRVQAGRPPNPSFGFGRLASTGFVELDRSVLFDVLGWLTLPLRAPANGLRFEQAQLQAAGEAVDVAAQVKRSYFAAVAAQQLTIYFVQVMEAADASNDLAKSMVAAGNLSQLDQMRQQAFYSDATVQLARARLRAQAARERLTRLMGLAADRPFRLPDRLPDLPPAPVEAREAQQAAIDRRLDVLAARRGVEATAKSLGLTRSTRFVNVLDAGFQNKSQSGFERQNGYQLDFELPLFDFGDARVAQAEAVYMQALHRAAATANAAQSEMREAYLGYQTAFDIARHYRDEVVPLRKRISGENLLRYNGMLIDVFQLLADAREQVAGVSGYVESLRDFWLADAELQTALVGRSPAAQAAN